MIWRHVEVCFVIRYVHAKEMRIGVDTDDG